MKSNHVVNENALFKIDNLPPHMLPHMPTADDGTSRYEHTMKVFSRRSTILNEDTCRIRLVNTRDNKNNR
jgi:hypothetical protein